MNYKNNETKGQVYDFSNLEKKNSKKRVKTVTSKELMLMKVVFRLVNEKDAGKLTAMAHRKIEDMVMIYGFDQSPFFHQLTKAEMERADIKETELYEAAMQNTPKYYPAIVKELNSFIREDLRCPDGVREDRDIIIVTNVFMSKGAGAVLYDNLLSDIADTYGSDLYMIPTSVHEFLITSTKDYSLAKVYEVFMCEREKLAPGEFLSKNIYRYSRENNKLSPVELG